MLCLTKDKEEYIKKIDLDIWRNIVYLSCLWLINQPFAQRNEVYNNNF